MYNLHFTILLGLYAISAFSLSLSPLHRRTPHNINCEGSDLCDAAWRSMQDVLDAANAMINILDGPPIPAFPTQVKHLINAQNNITVPQPGEPRYEAFKDVPLYVFIEGINLKKKYKNGEAIACYPAATFGSTLFQVWKQDSGVCAFLEDTEDGLTGEQIRVLSRLIVDYGCKACGSAPITYLEPHMVRAPGRLTFNYVYKVKNCGPRGYIGLCPHA